MSALSRFLLAFEGVLTPIEQIVDHFDLYLDPETTPTFFLAELAEWLGVALNMNWPEEKLRQLLREAPALFELRGTRRCLVRCLQLLTDANVEKIVSVARSLTVEQVNQSYLSVEPWDKRRPC